jgi:hypothetical protein
MALPTLDATFASAADLPRRQMLAKWLVEELGSGSIADYYDLPERYLWAKIAVAAGGPREEAAYISLPKNYAWSDIYNAVAGSSGNHTDWSENVALGHIAAAYRGDTGNPENLATYIDWPWRYKVASIIGTMEMPPPQPNGNGGPSFPSNGLLAFWKLGDLTDGSGNGNTLTNNNDATFSSGHIGNAVDIYQTEILSINGMTTIPWATAASLSGWYNTSTVQNGGLSLFFGKETGFAVGYRSNNVLTIFDYTGGEVYTSGSVVQNAWQHVVVTTSNGSMLVYLNGSLLGTYSNILSNISGLTIGDSVYTWNGQADAVGVWSRALTQQEVGALYNGGSGIEP